MKKYIVYLLLIALCLSTVACDMGGGAEEMATDTTVSSDSAEATQATQAEEPSETEEADTAASEAEESDTESAADTTAAEESNAPEETTASNESSETLTEAETETETETEDPRLSEKYAPTVYFDAKALYDYTHNGIFGENASKFMGYDEVTLLRDEGGVRYVKYLTYNDYGNAKEAFFSLLNGKTEVAPFMAIKYRTTTQNANAQIYADSVNFSAGNSSGSTTFDYEIDGEWHLKVIDLRSFKNFDGKTLNYLRFDFLNAKSGYLNVDSYVDFAYVGFFNSRDDVSLFETGELEKETVYIDPSSGYSESKLTHNTFIDMINGQNDSGVGTYDSRGGNSLTGIDTFNFNNTTFEGGVLVFSGWTVVEGGVEKFMWSADNGKTWFDCGLFRIEQRGDVGTAHVNATQSKTGGTIVDTVNSVKGGGYQGTVSSADPMERAKGVSCDLSDYAGKTVNVVFAAMPKNDPGKLSLIAYVMGVEVIEAEEEDTDTPEDIPPEIDPADCKDHSEVREWKPVVGTLKESGACVKCGTVTERAITFVVCSDKIVHGGGTRGWKSTCAQSEPYLVDDIGSCTLSSQGLHLQGWVAVNGGASAYKWSVDGENWFDVDSSSGYGIGSNAHYDAIDKMGTGIKDYKNKLQYNVTVGGLRELEKGTHTFYLGVVPSNNTDVVVPFIQINNVIVP